MLLPTIVLIAFTAIVVEANDYPGNSLPDRILLVQRVRATFAESGTELSTSLVPHFDAALANLNKVLTDKSSQAARLPAAGLNNPRVRDALASMIHSQTAIILNNLQMECRVAYIRAGRQSEEFDLANLMTTELAKVRTGQRGEGPSA